MERGKNERAKEWRRRVSESSRGPKRQGAAPEGAPSVHEVLFFSRTYEAV